MATQITQMDRFLREPEVKRKSGLSRSTRWRLERIGEFPRRRRISANAVGWLESELDAWIAARAGEGKGEGEGEGEEEEDEKDEKDEAENWIMKPHRENRKADRSKRSANSKSLHQDRTQHSGPSAFNHSDLPARFNKAGYCRRPVAIGFLARDIVARLRTQAKGRGRAMHA